MRITVVGGGPAGLYFSLLMKKADPAHDVRVFERNPPGATYGWGVVFSDRTLESFREADYKTYLDITEQFVIWDAIDIRFKGRVLRCGGQIFSGIARRRLLRILQERCAELGVELLFERDVEKWGDLEIADLVVAADGVKSVVRAAHEDSFKPRMAFGSSRYIWFGTELPLDSFTFIFREAEHGLFQVHAYPFDGSMSTFIVECDEETWRRAGLDAADESASLEYCEHLFSEDLRGYSLMSNNSQWLSFATLKNRSWGTDNVVLVGDAAHTAHFSIGSGTKLAMEDAIALVDAWRRTGDVTRALDEYEAERKPVVERFQEAAAQSQAYFESTARYLSFEPERFAFHLLSRSGRMDYPNIRLRDPQFIAVVDEQVAWGGAAGRSLPPPPALTPVRLGDLTLVNRAVAAQPPVYGATDGLAGQDHRAALDRAATSGAGLIVTQPVAVAPDGRTTVGCPGIYSPEHAEAWAALLETRPRAAAKMCLQLSHAGPRGGTAARSDGVDVQVSAAPPLIAASEYSYTPGGRAARAMDRSDMERVRVEFVAAAGRGVHAGFDMLQIDMAHGGLLASFISPLTNLRGDDYGGALLNRIKFPLEILRSVVEAVGLVPVAVSISARDEARGGADLDAAVTVARALKAAGCALVVVLTGQTTAASRPPYDAYTLASYSDRIRNESGVATMACGNISTMDQVSTIVAGGRADLCRMLVD
jgi:anthraniloyl-CoA monooxygenase